MKNQLQQFLTDLSEFSADLKSICNRQTAHDALLNRWDHIRHDNYQRFPLILTAAIHLFVLILTITAPFLMSRSLRIPEVYTVNLYQVPEPSLQTTATKPVTVTKAATKKAVASRPVKPDAVSLSPIRQRLEKERQEKELKRLQEEVRLRKIDQVKAELQRQLAEKEARETTSKALSSLTEHLKSTATGAGEKQTPTAVSGSANGKGEVDPRKLEALDRYRARLFEHISPHWQLPELQDWDESLRAVIILRVKRDGTVTSSFFEKRSGNLRFNQYAQKAIENAQPLPPFPIDFREKSEEIAVTFSPGGLM
jgi:TonB family protein